MYIKKMAKGSKKQKRASVEDTESPVSTRSQRQRKNRTNTPVEEDVELNTGEETISNTVPDLEGEVVDTREQPESLDSASEEESDEESEEPETSLEDAVANLKRKVKVTRETHVVSRRNIRRNGRNLLVLRETILEMEKQIISIENAKRAKKFN
jgi:hypothetical protein